MELKRFIVNARETVYERSVVLAHSEKEALEIVNRDGCQRYSDEAGGIYVGSGFLWDIYDGDDFETIEAEPENE